MPRFYSASSSPLQYPNSLHFAFTVVRTSLPELYRALPWCSEDGPTPVVQARTKCGLCTNWLYSLCQKARLLPKDLESERNPWLLTPPTPSLTDEHPSKKSLDPIPDLHLPPAAKPISNTASILSSSKTSLINQCSDSRSSLLHLPLFLRRAPFFKLPADLSVPVLMIGAGTGVAVFRGFLQHRQAQSLALKEGSSSMGQWRGVDLAMVEEEEKVNEMVDKEQPFSLEFNLPELTKNAALCARSCHGHMELIFGCRDIDQDALYLTDLMALKKAGTLTHLYLALSRPSPPKVKQYVQDVVREHGEHFTRLICEHRCAVYVCGDGLGMAKGVKLAFKEILVSYGKMTVDQANSYIASMVKQKRYCQDIWS